MFRVLLKNILENASRYTPDHKKEIDVFIENKQENFIEIIIKDYGSGLKKDDLERVFEPFYRAEESRSRSSGGFGLGLYLTKQIVIAHGGEIWIKNNNQSGAQVNIILPSRQN